MRTLNAISRCISLPLSFALLLSGLVLPVQAQRRIIVINADQPSVWTLEQAHYLLAQMHRRNLDLKAKSLEDLDPNEISGLRFDVMRMLIEFGATFNQADAAANRMFAQNQEFNSERRRELTAEADRLRRESIALAGEIDELETQKADAESDEEKARLDAKIASKKNRLAKVDKELTNINEELKTLNVSAGELKGTTASAEFDPKKLPEGVFDEAFEKAAAKQIEKFNEAPKLNASLRLDNFLQMQYEIISKQLTLLRDELGPGERLVFLEMPQTINVAHHEADKKWAQSWWKIAGYTKREREGQAAPVSASTVAVRENQPPITTSNDLNSIVNGEPINLALARPTHTPEPCNSSPIVTKTYTDVVRVPDASDREKVVVLTAPVNMPGRVTNVTIEFRGFSHERPDDLDMLLVGPERQNAIIWSDAGGDTRVSGLDITLTDALNPYLPDAAPLTGRSYRPENHDGGTPDVFPAPAPAPLGGSAFSVFNRTNPNGEWKLYIVDDNNHAIGSFAQGWSLNITTSVPCPSPTPTPTPLQVAYQDVFIPLTDNAGVTEPNLNTYLSTNRSYLSNRQVRTVELIPRQSSLNVNDMKLKTTAGAFNFVLSTLFGFGSQLNIQRQREQFAQFVQQELYSSAFGKGSREFGWTFTPMPGMDRLQSGVRTTYAVVVVPDDATSLVLETNGCYFPRSAYQPLNFAHTKDGEWNVAGRTSRNCSGQRSKAFIVPIPTATLQGTNDFWVNNISYQPVGRGKRIVVLISGQNFSSQIGVLINGVPLPHSIGLAQPLIRDDSNAGKLTERDFTNAEIQGRVERIDAKKIVFSFKMPEDYGGTPTITLVAPGKAIDLNWLTNIGINGDPAPATLSGANKDACKSPPTPGCAVVGAPMFADAAPRQLRIDKVEAFRRPRNRINVLIHGAGFEASHRVFVNGFQRAFGLASPTLLTATDIPAPADDQIQISLATNETTIKSSAVVNPFHLKIDKVTVISYEEATNRRPGVLVVRLEGAGFRNDLLRSPTKVRLNVTSTNEAFLTIPNPNQAEVVTLTDPVTKISVSTLVARKPPE